MFTTKTNTSHFQLYGIYDLGPSVNMLFFFIAVLIGMIIYGDNGEDDVVADDQALRA